MSDAVDPHLGEPDGPRTRSCATELVCPDCGYRTPLRDTTFRCPAAARASTSTTTTSAPSSGSPSAALDERPLNIWRYEELLPIVIRSAPERVGRFSGQTPLIRAERLGAELGLSNLYIKDDSTNRPSLSYKDRVVSMAVARAAGAGQGRDRLRLDRQRRHRDRLAGGQGRRHRLHLLPGQHRAGQGERLPRARRRGLPARRQLRRSQPRLPRAGASHRHAVRQHHPAPVLRRGGEDDRLRGRRAARLGLARPLRHPGRRRHPLLARPQGPERAGDGRPGARPRRPRSTSPRPRGCSPIATAILERRRDRAAAAGDRRPTRWRSALPATAPWSSTRSAARGGSAATAPDGEIFERDRPARRDRGHAHRAGRRHHDRRDGEARRRGQDRRRRDRRRRDQRQRPEDASASIPTSRGRKWSPATSRRWSEMLDDFRQAAAAALR